MTFEATRSLPTQEHFYIVEIDLPIVTGTCELTPGNEGYGTVLSCPIQDGTSAIATKTYYFATQNAPIPLGITPCYRCLTAVSETATELKSGLGLAARGRATLTFVDFNGLDPNPERASTAAIKNQGSFFGKFSARNVVESHPVRIKKYRKHANLNLATDAQTTHYFMRSLNRIKGQKWQIVCADELSNIEIDQAQLPETQNGFLRQDITDSAISIPVDQNTDWTTESTPYIITVGDELMTVISVSNNLTASASLNVRTRGVDIGSPDFSETISKTDNVEHSAGDEVFKNITYDNENIADALRDLLLRVGVRDASIPLTDWQDEVNLWHGANPNITTTFYESKSANKTLLKILEPYMLDMWADPVDDEIKLKAISQWQEASATLADGKEIDYDTIDKKELEDMRFSRAFIGYDKPFLTSQEEDTSYKKGSLSIRGELEAPELYGKPKSRKFDNSTVIDGPVADLLVSRFTQRYGFTPSRYSWTTQERNLTFKTGDVVFLKSNDLQDISGAASGDIRAQVTKIQPILGPYGREYKCEALTYSSAIPEDVPITIQGGAELNLFVVAGGPAVAGDFTFILDGGEYSSTTNTVPSIRAGSFPTGSTLVIICRGGADWQSKGGDFDDSDGGICYSADGVDTDIYLSGADPEGGTADGYLRAPGGAGESTESNDEPFTFGLGGGGAGIDVGKGNGTAGDGTKTGTGGAGTTDGGSTGGDGGGWGENGGTGSGDTTTFDAGAAGKGIIKGGAVVNLFGETAARFINGGGDTPDS